MLAETRGFLLVGVGVGPVALRLRPEGAGVARDEET